MLRAIFCLLLAGKDKIIYINSLSYFLLACLCPCLGRGQYSQGPSVGQRSMFCGGEEIDIKAWLWECAH